MKILLTGTTGYIGRRLLPALLNDGHEVICCVRDRQRFDPSSLPNDNWSLIEVNFLEPKSLQAIPYDIDAAYYLIHSMSAASGDFVRLEKESAINFREALSQTNVQQVVYLSGIVNEKQLSKHLSSRKEVEDLLSGGCFQLTTLRAGIIVGSGSASFEIIRDLVEKLPLMIAPRWLNTRSQPIAVRNVIQFLKGVLLREDCFSQSFDIGGPEILTYKQMLLQFAAVRSLKRTIYTVPVMTPRLSSYWLYFVTSTSYKLAVHLVNSMKVEVICRPNNLAARLNIELFSYREAVRLAFGRIRLHDVTSSWTDALSGPLLEDGIAPHISVPEHGCFIDKRSLKVQDEEKSLNKIWAIGGATGWYYANWLWALRGFLDKLSGGVGLRRGRRCSEEIHAGDALDFWRVLLADKSQKRLLLYAEMKLPGEAWLEFRIANGTLHQTATFRPIGVLGRLYWYSVLPFHAFIFGGMAKKIASTKNFVGNDNV